MWYGLHPVIKKALRVYKHAVSKIQKLEHLEFLLDAASFIWLRVS